MKEYIKLFNNHDAYTAFTQTEDFVKPNVSHCITENEVHYNPFVPPFFCKLTLNNGSTVELEGSGELTQAMVSDQYKDTLVSAEIGELCTSIGQAAFYNCSILTSIIIPDSVTSIGNIAFNTCSSLPSITFPNSITSIGTAAFVNCTNLSTITSYIMNAPNINTGTFHNVKRGGILYVPIGSSGYGAWIQGNLGYSNWTKVEQ